MNTTLRYHTTAEAPNVSLWLKDDDGDLIDFSSGYTFSLKVGTPGNTAALTKTTGITGAAGAGVEPTGTPNVTITWTAGELAITPGLYTWQLTCTTGTTDRLFEGLIRIDAVIS